MVNCIVYKALAMDALNCVRMVIWYSHGRLIFFAHILEGFSILQSLKAFWGLFETHPFIDWIWYVQRFKALQVVVLLGL